MNLIKKIFGQENGLTSRQFYFPYFFNERDFRKLISPFNLTTVVKFNEKTKMASELDLINNDETKLKVEFGQSLMVENGNLTIWSTNKDTLTIKKIDLEFDSDSKTIEIEIPKLEIGINQLENNLNLRNFTTYVRSEKIEYDLDYYETFAIIVITDNVVEMIPFDWFNEKGGDYGYVWPALAQINTNGNLIGSGMRMGDFKTEIRKKAYNIIGFKTQLSPKKTGRDENITHNL